MPIPPFHLAIMVSNIAAAREFYGDLLSCAEGRSSETWVDFNFYGHQLVCHLLPPGEMREGPGTCCNPVDGHAIPVPHFGVVLRREQWERLAERLKERGARFIIEPYVRFRGLPGEQATMFILDPSGNALEFKSFTDIDAKLFEK